LEPYGVICARSGRRGDGKAGLKSAAESSGVATGNDFRKSPRRGMSVTLVACLLGGCAPKGERLRVLLEDRDPSVQVRAIRAVAEQERHELIPALIDRLDDEDPAVRLYAILALEKLTGTRHGYDYAASSVDRQVAIDQWRDEVRRQASPATAEN
jgi:hypothetical protein